MIKIGSNKIRTRRKMAYSLSVIKSRKYVKLYAIT